MIGKVAEKSMSCRSLGKKLRSCSMTTVNSGLSNLSASSITKVEQLDKSATPLPAKSSILPGVPTKICTVCDKRKISSFKLVPPVVTITSTPKCLPNVLHTWDVCKASSRVGTRRSAWILLTLVLIFSSVGITNAAVLPVPYIVSSNSEEPMS